MALSVLWFIPLVFCTFRANASAAGPDIAHRCRQYPAPTGCHGEFIHRTQSLRVFSCSGLGWAQPLSSARGSLPPRVLTVLCRHPRYSVPIQNCRTLPVSDRSIQV